MHASVSWTSMLAVVLCVEANNRDAAGITMFRESPGIVEYPAQLDPWMDHQFLPRTF